MATTHRALGQQAFCKAIPVPITHLASRSSCCRVTNALASSQRCAFKVTVCKPTLPARRSRTTAVAARAMVNVDFASPSLVLGAGLIGCGILLLQMRNFQNRISRDADIVVAAMVSIVGSTLIFQGWRLDPLLLLCQALTTSVAFWYGLETFRLRSKEQEGPYQQLPPGEGAAPEALENNAYYQDSQYPSSTGQYQNQSGAPYLPAGQDPSYPFMSQDRGYNASWDQAGTAEQYDETIRYDYYGNPITQPDSSTNEQYYSQTTYPRNGTQGYDDSAADGYGASSSNGYSNGDQAPSDYEGQQQLTQAGTGSWPELPMPNQDQSGAYMGGNGTPRPGNGQASRPVAVQNRQSRLDVYSSVDDWE